MAGGKETPRQRLIGLMYLVLLALLALQVSDSIMEKFYFLEQSLYNARIETVSRSEARLKSITSQAAERGTEDSKKIAAAAKEVRKETEALLKYIDGLKESVVAETGGREEEHGGLYTGRKTPIPEIMLGPGDSKNGKGYDFKKKLDDWSASIKKYIPKDPKGKPAVEITELALNGNEDPYFMKNSDQNTKDFATLNFDHSSPMVTVMAILEEKANKVSSYEALILSALDPEGQVIKIDKLVPTYAALSQVVAAGMDYEANVFLSAKNEKLKPSVNFNGSNLPIEADGSAKIKFKASGGAYDKDGLVKKSWSAKVGVPLPGGKIEYEEVKGEYFVAKPVLDIKSAAVSALYENCGNELKIGVPSLGANYKPSFTCNAFLQQGASKGDVIVVPANKNDVSIGVSSGGTFIDKVVYKVKSVPLPRIVVRSGGQEVNLKNGIKSSTPSLSVSIVAESGFAEFLPKEANYSISEMYVQIGRGKAAKKSMTLQAGNIKLSDANITDGDRVVIELKKIYRTNYKGEKIEVNLGSQSLYNVSIIDK